MHANSNSDKTILNIMQIFSEVKLFFFKVFSSKNYFVTYFTTKFLRLKVSTLT